MLIHFPKHRRVKEKIRPKWLTNANLSTKHKQDGQKKDALPQTQPPFSPILISAHLRNLQIISPTGKTDHLYRDDTQQAMPRTLHKSAKSP